MILPCWKNSDLQGILTEIQKILLKKKSHYHIYDPVSTTCQELGKLDCKIRKSLKGIRFNTVPL